MNYRRILLLTTLKDDSSATFSTLRSFLPSAEHVTVVVLQPMHSFAWLSSPTPPDDREDAAAWLEHVRLGARQTAPDVDVQLAHETPVDRLASAVADAGIDLVVLDPDVPDRTSVAVEVRKRTAVAVLQLPDAPTPADAAGLLLCVGLSQRARWAIARFLHAHAGQQDRALLVSGAPLSDDDVRQVRDIAGLTVDIQPVRGGAALRQLLKRDSDVGQGLIVLPRFPPAFLLASALSHAVLILPPLRPSGTEWGRTLDVPDLIDDGRSIRVRAEYAVGIGRRTPIANQELAFVSDGTVVARAFSGEGELELASGLGESLGVFRRRDQAGAEVLSSIEARVSVLRPDSRRLLLFDAELDADDLRTIGAVTWAAPVGVRVRSTRSCRSLRARLRTNGLPPVVIDTGAVLDEGDAHDVSARVDAVRLARTASRLRAAGFRVSAIVYRGPHAPSTIGFPAVRPQELSALTSPASDVPRRESVAARLDATIGSEVITGNRIEVELDNPKARHWLLQAIENSQRRVHFQVYMALDDDVGRPIEAALAAAAARGVTVRVLVDSLHGWHGSFGLHNPIFDRLSSRPGVEFRVGNPLTRESSLEDLKQRDHRKLVVVDGRIALLGGRNLSHEYYTGFEEVALHPAMTWRMVPWLDAGARVEGPAVAALERSFLQAWMDAGGTAFDISVSVPAATAAARVVVHQGLRDAYTVEAYLAMIETARSHVYVVNGFPLLLEIQHALLRALKRGVRVRTLVGNLTPRHRDGSFEGPWASARTIATSFVHSRMDPLVAAGAECYEYVVPHQPHWDPSVGDVRPHVHAKAMSADGQVCAVGSANLDVTAGYWESELLLVVEDESIAAGVEAKFEELLARSRRVDSRDPAWQRRAEQRGWMRYWPGLLSG